MLAEFKRLHQEEMTTPRTLTKALGENLIRSEQAPVRFVPRNAYTTGDLSAANERLTPHEALMARVPRVFHV
jgi:hypothetical protein